MVVKDDGLEYVSMDEGPSTHTPAAQHHDGPAGFVI